MYKPSASVKVRRLIYVGGICLVVAATGFFAYKAVAIVSAPNPGEIWKSFSGAFFGALLGLLTLALAEWVRGVLRKSAEAHDAFVHLELYLNDLQNTCYQNIITLKDYQGHVQRIISTKPQVIINPISIYFLQPLPENWKNIRDTEIINRLFSLNLGLTKINKNLGDTQEIKSRVEETIQSNPSGSIDFNTLMGGLIPRSEQIITMLDSTKNSVIDLLALVRCILKAKSPSIWFTHVVLDLFRQKVSPADVEAERVQMLAEIQDTLKRSTEKQLAEIEITKAKLNTPP